MEELEKLFNALVENGRYSKSFEEFKTQFSNEDYQAKVFSAVSSDKLYSKDINSFKQKYAGKLNGKEVDVGSVALPQVNFPGLTRIKGIEPEAGDNEYKQILLDINAGVDVNHSVVKKRLEKEYFNLDEFGADGMNKYYSEEENYKRYFGEDKHKHWQEYQKTGKFNTQWIDKGTSTEMIDRVKQEQMEQFVARIDDEDLKGRLKSSADAGVFNMFGPEDGDWVRQYEAALGLDAAKEARIKELGGLKVGLTALNAEENNKEVMRLTASASEAQAVLGKYFESKYSSINDQSTALNTDYGKFNKIGKDFEAKAGELKKEFDLLGDVDEFSSSDKIAQYNALIAKGSTLKGDYQATLDESGLNEKALIASSKALMMSLNKVRDNYGKVKDINVISRAMVKDYSLTGNLMLQLEDVAWQIAGGVNFGLEKTAWLSDKLGGTVDAIISPMGKLSDVDWSGEKDSNKAFMDFWKENGGASINYTESLQQYKQAVLPSVIDWSDVDSDNIGTWAKRALGDNIFSIGAALSYGGAIKLGMNIPMATKVLSGTFFAVEAAGKLSTMQIDQKNAPKQIMDLQAALAQADAPDERAKIIKQIDYYSKALTATEWEKAFSSSLYGGIAMYAERLGTMRIMRGLMTTAPTTGRLTLANTIKGAGTVGLNTGIEYVEEFGTQVGHNLVDMLVLDQNKSLLHGVDANFNANIIFSTLAIQGPSTGMNIVNTLRSEVNTQVEIGKNRERARKLFEINQQLQDPTEVNKMSQGYYDELVGQSKALIREAALEDSYNFAEVANMSAAELKSMFDLNQSKRDELNKIQNLGASSVTSSNKEYIEKEKKKIINNVEQIDRKRSELRGKPNERRRDDLEAFLGKGKVKAETEFFYGKYQGAKNIAKGLAGKVKEFGKVNEDGTLDLTDLGEYLDKKLDNGQITKKQRKAYMDGFSSGNFASFVGNEVILVDANIMTAINNAETSLEKSIAAYAPLHELQHINDISTGLVKDLDVVTSQQGVVAGIETQIEDLYKQGKIKEKNYKVIKDRIAGYKKSNNGQVDLMELLTIAGELKDAGILNQNSVDPLLSMKLMINQFSNKYFKKGDMFFKLKSTDDVLRYIDSFQRSTKNSSLILGPEEEKTKVTKFSLTPAEKAAKEKAVNDLGKMGWDDKTWKESGAKFAIETIKDEKLLDALIYTKYKVEDVPANFVNDVITALTPDIKKFNSSYVDKKTGKKVEAKWGTKDENNSLFGYLQGLMRYRADDVYNELYKGDDAIKGAKNIGETTKEGEVKIQVAAEKSSEMEAFEEEDLSIQGQAKKAKAKEQRHSKLRQEMGFKREVLDKDGNVVEEGDKIHKEILENVKKSLMIAYGTTQNIADVQLRAQAIAAKLKKEYANLNSPLFKQIKNFLTYGVADTKVPYGTKDIYISQLKKYREAIVESISTADLVQMERNTPEADRVFTDFVKVLTSIDQVRDAVNKEQLPPDALNKITKDKKTGKGAFSPSLYDKIMPSPTELVSWADQPGKNPITGLRQGLKGTRKDGLAMRMVNSLVTDAIMEARQSDQVQERIAGMDIDPGSVAELGAAIGREVNVKFSKSNAIEDISAAMNGSGSVNVYSQIKFSKSHREAYEKQLTKRRPDLTEKQRKNAVQSVFDFVDGKEIPNHLKSKYEKMAMHYTANGFLILPEDGYKVIEAEKIATQKKLDPFSFKNPNELIEAFVGEVKGTRTNPDKVKTFTNKTQLTNGVTVYDVEDSKQGQIDSRKVIDTHFGKKANPWCLLARTKSGTEGGDAIETVEYNGLENVIKNQYLDESYEYGDAEILVKNTNKQKVEKLVVKLLAEYSVNGTNKYKYKVSTEQAAITSFGDGKKGDVQISMTKIGQPTNLDNAWFQWEHYNKEGYGHKIAFQNGRLIAFRDGNNMNWWDRNDKPTSGVVVRGKKVDGFKEVIEVNKTKETLLYYEKVTGDKKNGTTIHKDLDGLVILKQTKVDGGFEGEVIKVDKDNKKSNEYHRTQTENYRDGLREDYKEVRTYIDKKATVKTAFGRDEIRLDNITKYERYFLESEDNIRLPDNEVITIEGTVNQKYFKEFNDPSSVTGWEKTNLPYLTPTHERYYGMQGQKVKIVSNSGIGGQTLEDIQTGNTTTVTINGVEQETRVRFSKSAENNVKFSLSEVQQDRKILPAILKKQIQVERRILEQATEEDLVLLESLSDFENAITSGLHYEEAYNGFVSNLPPNTAALLVDFKNIKAFEQYVVDIKVPQIRKLGLDAAGVYFKNKFKTITSTKDRVDLVNNFLKNIGISARGGKGLIKSYTNQQLLEGPVAEIFGKPFVEKHFNLAEVKKGKTVRYSYDGKSYEKVPLYKDIDTIKESRGKTSVVKEVNSEAKEARAFVQEIIDSDMSVSERLAIIDLISLNQRGATRKMPTFGETVTDKVTKPATELVLEHEITVKNMTKYLRQRVKGILKQTQLEEIMDQAKVHVWDNGIDKVLNAEKTIDGKSLRQEGGRTRYQNPNVNGHLQNKRDKGLITNMPSTMKPVNNLPKAVQFSRSANNPTKGITVLDFDDTLATSKSLIRFTRPDGTKGTLNAEQYASTYENLSELGYKFDFSEFTKVVDGKTAPLFNKAMKLQGKFGPENMFVLTARPAESAGAIHAFLKANGLNIPLKNITGLANSTAEAKALWMAEKVGEGYNDFYFADDALQNVKAVKNMLNQFDVKSKVQQARVKFSKSMDEKFNDILENVTSIESKKRFSEIKGRKRGDDKGKFRLFIPPSHEDFIGLLYNFMGRGREGDRHRDFFEQALVRPINRAYREIDAAKQAIADNYKALNKKFPEIKDKLIKTTPDGDFTFSDAIRVYLWNKHGHKIPGLTETDQAKLTELVQSDPQLQAYAETLNMISKQETYVAPGQSWEMGNIRIDLVDATGRVGRAEYFAEYQENAEIIFSEENLNKIEAGYGKDFRSALEDMLHRIKTGVNRPKGASAKPNMFMNWLNASVAGVMFFNTRSALLQQMSNVNYLNFADNNIYTAGKAFANQPQYWKDFAMIFNSDMLKQRRGGLGTDINGAELAEAIKKARPDSMFDQVAIITGKALKLGFLPTQIGDNIAIATGGAAFYRNRVNTYLKQGMSVKEAESKAFTDFQNITQSTQQSARPDMTSQQQASWIGKLVLNFLNTPSQYNRIIKKAGLDIKNRRITAPNTTQIQSDMSNLSRMLYYGAAQNLIFYTLQTALFAVMFGDDEDEEAYLKKKERVISGTIDTLLRGSGIYGVAVSTLKNMTIKFIEQREKGYNKDESAVLMEGLNFSPVLGIKARGIVSAEKTLNYNMPVIKEMELLDIDNPIWSASTNIVQSTTGAPLNKTHQKIINLRNATDNQYTAFQRAMFLSGYTTWSMNLGDTDKMKNIKQDVKDKNKKKKDKNKKKKKSKYSISPLSK